MTPPAAVVPTAKTSTSPARPPLRLAGLAGDGPSDEPRAGAAITRLARSASAMHMAELARRALLETSAAQITGALGPARQTPPTSGEGG